MDRLDRKILAVLQGNARASLQEIGQAVVRLDAAAMQMQSEVA